jgi:hypothetical protein
LRDVFQIAGVPDVGMVEILVVLMDVIFVKMMTVKKKLKLIYKSVYIYKYNFLFMKEVCKFVFTSWRSIFNKTPE